MAYQALYRKYRSQRFDEMIGQEVVATTLKNAIVNDQISHAYLFSGPRGTGKTSAAKIFAKAINCPNQKDGEPCNQCEVCQSITRGNFEDVIELDAASNNGVDEIREIRDKSTYAASLAKYKVYIIDEVHMLSTGAFNALLKTLEEPTAGVVFILATTELQKIPATIISRVQRFAFKAISTADIRGHLSEVLADEGLEFEPAALDVIARSAEGGMRDALSLLDQALSFSDEQLTLNAALLVTGAIADEALMNYVNALVNSDLKTALQELDQIFAEGKNMSRFVEDLLGYFRDQLFDEKSKIPHERLYLWVDIAIGSLKMLKETSQTKIAADVMTMRLSEASENEKVLATQTVLTSENSRAETKAFHDEKVEPVDLPVEPVFEEAISEIAVEPSNIQISDVKSSREVNRQQVLDVLDQAVLEPNLIKQVRAVWQQVTSALANPRDMALVKASRLAAVSSQNLILTVEQDNLAKLIATNSAISENIDKSLSEFCLISPEIITLTDKEWREIRAEYAQAHRNGGAAAEKVNSESEKADEELELAQKLFGEKVLTIAD